MRPEEVYTIRPENVDLLRQTIQIPHGKTMAARRMLTLTSAAVEVLKRRMNGMEAPYIFPCETNPQRPIPKVNNAHDRAVRESKIAPLRLYDLRHTWATRAAMSGIDPCDVGGDARPFEDPNGASLPPPRLTQAKAMEQLEKFNVAQQFAAFEKEQSAMAQ